MRARSIDYYVVQGVHDSACRLRVSIINPRRACTARVTVSLVCPSVSVVCLSVFLTLFLELQATKQHANGTLIFSTTSARKIMWQIWLITAVFWQEKPPPLWTKFRDPIPQLAWCTCIFITYVINEVISKAKANNSTNPEQPFFQRKKSCPGWDLNPRLSAF